MDTTFLESFYEKVILPRYSDTVTFKHIIWKDHGKLGPDSWAHYFDNEEGREFVLLYEDFPGDSPFDDGLSHELVKVGDETSIGLKFDNGPIIDNITGYFTLYQEKR